jgi:hypothetical protein
MEQHPHTVYGIKTHNDIYIYLCMTLKSYTVGECVVGSHVGVVGINDGIDVGIVGFIDVGIVVGIVVGIEVGIEVGIDVVGLNDGLKI